MYGRTGSTNTLAVFTAASQTGAIQHVIPDPKVVQAVGFAAGAFTAAVSVYGTTSNTAINGVLLGTISLSGTGTATDGFAFSAPWPYVYAVSTVTAFTGSPTVTVYLGV
jgi:hypothetical protein